jgi:hypothetical protein
MLANGTVSVHDNGTDWPRPPRIAHFRIDERRRTATLLASLSDPMARHSYFAGSARHLPGGHWVANWGGTPLTSELTASGKVVFRLGFVGKDLYSYRTFPIPRGTLSRKRLRRAMDARYGRPER